MKTVIQNTLVGTPVYLSPILWNAYTNNTFDNISHDLELSDVFSLGLTIL